MQSMRVLLFQECNWWVAQCLTIELATQGGSQDEALANITEALALQQQQPCGQVKEPPQTLTVPTGATEVSVNVGA